MDKGLCATAAETFLVTFLTLLVQNMPCCVGVAYPNILIPVVRGQNMKNLYWVLPAAAILFVAMATGARAQSRPGGGASIVPSSSIQRPEDAGKRAHTNIEISRPPAGEALIRTPNTPGGFFETPASLACVYELVKQANACNPTIVTANATGGWGAIVLVDAYDDPNAANDLSAFSMEFSLPQANFHVMYENGVQPSQDPTGGWESEESIDIEMAHAMAPSAAIYLMEAQSSSFTDLFTAIDQANTMILEASRRRLSLHELGQRRV